MRYLESRADLPRIPRLLVGLADIRSRRLPLPSGIDSLFEIFRYRARVFPWTRFPRFDGTGWPGLMFVHLDQGGCSPGVLHPSCSMEESADGPVFLCSVRVSPPTIISTTVRDVIKLITGREVAGTRYSPRWLMVLSSRSSRHPRGGILAAISRSSRSSESCCTKSLKISPPSQE